MSSQHDRVEELFWQASQIDSETERKLFLEEACGRDEVLLEEVNQLLSSRTAAEEMAEAYQPTIALARHDMTGQTIGPYKLRERIGEGGMGVVYTADQKKPVKRRVALKIIKPGMDSRQVIARFESERQTLALMDHPNIARVLDAGTTDRGLPYFVMELVNGVPITRYCDEHRLTIRQRLELMVPICRAVQHAHQKGIIHRDLKPSNILVAQYDGNPVPKVIDFGVAKAVGSQLGDYSVYTEFGMLIGTLEYMSPEQAQRNQLDIDTRSDVYSLGVVLYELLVGTTPFDSKRLRSAALEELLSIIRDEEPPRPSLKLSTSRTLPDVASSRAVSPDRLSKVVRGELDWIVMKALEKDRNRRYESSLMLGQDLERFLNSEAVLASPTSGLYRLRKLAARHKLMLATVAIILLSMLAGLATTTWQASIARAERDKSMQAETQAELDREAALMAQREAQIMSDFLMYDLLGMANPKAQFEHGVVPDPDIKVLTLVERAVDLLGKLEDQPEVYANLQYVLANTLNALDRPEQALELHQRVAELYSQLHGPEDETALNAQVHIVATLNHLRRFSEAIELANSLLDSNVLPIHLKLGLMQHLAWSYERTGDNEKTIAIVQYALEESEQQLGHNDDVTLSLLATLGDALLGRWEGELALQRYGELAERLSKTKGDRHPETLRAKGRLANAALFANKTDEAIRGLEELTAPTEETYGEQSRQYVELMRTLATAYEQARRLDRAVEAYRKGYEAALTFLPPEHFERLAQTVMWADHMLQTNRPAEALKVLSPAVPFLLQAGEEQSLDAAALATMAINILNANEQWETALQISDWLVKLPVLDTSANISPLLNAHYTRAMSFSGLRRFAEAADEAERILEICKTRDHADEAYLFDVDYKRIIWRYVCSKQWLQSAEQFRNGPPNANWDFLEAMTFLAAGEPAQSRQVIQQSYEDWHDTLQPFVDIWLCNSGGLLPIAEDEREQWRAFALSVLSRTDDFSTRQLAAMVLARCGDSEQALAALERCLAELEADTALTDFPQGLWLRLALAHLEAGHVEEAETWLKKAEEKFTEVKSDSYYPWQWNRAIWFELLRDEIRERPRNAINDVSP